MQRSQPAGWHRLVSAQEPTHFRPAAPCRQHLPPDLSIPYLSLCGVWLERLGFKTDHPVFVEVAPGRVTLTLDETPVPLPYRYRYRKHDPKKERSRKGRSEQ